MNDSTTGDQPDLERQAPRTPTRVTIRRAPRMGAFLFLGAALGLVVTLFLTGLYPADPNVGFAALFGYFALYGVPAGTVLGALVGLVLDRVSRRRTRTVDAERTDVESPPAEGELED